MPRLKKKEPSLDELFGEPKKTRGRKPSKKRAKKVVQETPQVVEAVAPASPHEEIKPGSEWAHQGIKRNTF